MLIVDDEVIEREYLKSIFARYPSRFFIVGEANNGVQAIDLAIEKKPDIIILDIYMPGCNGLAAAKKIKEHLNPIIILNTAYSEFDYALEAVNLNLDSYLLEPATEEDILATINDCIKRSHKQRSDTNYNDLFPVKDKEYPFTIITEMINSIKKYDSNEFQFGMISFLQFLESKLDDIYEYNIYIFNSIFSILMAIKESFPESIYSLFDSEHYLHTVANSNHQQDVIDIVSDLLQKISIIIGSKSIIKPKFSSRIQRCFLQGEIPHFCKSFSPGTGGEFLCQPNQ
ncbi:MAG: response regulator [Tissierellaceae bacterium]